MKRRAATGMGSLALAHMRAKGWQVANVQRFIKHIHVTQDAFGFGDYLACKALGAIGGVGPTLVQVTDGSNHSHRREKILSEPRALAWLQSGGLVLLLSFSKKGGRGARKLWEPREEWVTEADFGGKTDEGTPEGVEETFAEDRGARPWPLE